MPDTATLALVVGVLVATARSATPLILAGMGELVAERSGVLNLGVEGTMLMGAACGFIGTVVAGPVVGLLCAAAAGAAMSLLFAGLTLGLMANQVAAGLALTIFGIGFSAMLGAGYQGQPLPGLATTLFPDLATQPPLVQQVMLLDPLVWLAFLLPPAVAWFLYRTRPGLVLRAVGESHDVAFALGYSVRRIRLLAVLFGGVMSGLAGASLSLAYTPIWSENMIAGRGWIALALVVFSTWKPMLLLAGAVLFGFVTILQFQAEALGIRMSSHLLAMLPYLATVLVLVLISRDPTRLRLSAPAALGKPFHATS